jgi:hypothetical protein
VVSVRPLVMRGAASCVLLLHAMAEIRIAHPIREAPRGKSAPCCRSERGEALRFGEERSRARYPTYALASAVNVAARNALVVSKTP